MYTISVRTSHSMSPQPALSASLAATGRNDSGSHCETVFEPCPRNHRNLHQRQASAPRGAFLRYAMRLQQLRGLPAQLDPHPVLRLRIAPQPHLAQHLPEQRVRGHDLVAAGQNCLQVRHLLAVEGFQLSLRRQDDLLLRTSRGE